MTSVTSWHKPTRTSEGMNHEPRTPVITEGVKAKSWMYGVYRCIFRNLKGKGSPHLAYSLQQLPNCQSRHLAI